MSRTVQALFAALFILVAADHARGIEVKLSYKHFHQAEDDLVPRVPVLLAKTLSLPDGDWSLPDLESEYPVFALLSVGGGERLLVLDKKDNDDPFYSLAYFDSNGNHDLTDDDAVEARNPPEESGYKNAFSFENIPFSGGGESSICSFQVFTEFKGRVSNKLKKSSIERSLDLYISTSCCYTGAFEMNGRHYRVCLADGNGNGTVDDKLSVPDLTVLESGSPVSVRGDWFAVTSGESVEAADFQVYGRCLVLDGQAYVTEVDMNAGIFSLDPAAAGEELCRLGFSMDVERIGLYEEQGAVSVMIYRPGREAMLPAGRYRMSGYRAVREDGQGDVWAIEAAATRDTPAITLSNGGSKTLNLGEPYTPYVDVPAWSVDGIKYGYSTGVSLDFKIEGAAGEVVLDLLRIRGTSTSIPLSMEDDTRPMEPAYAVNDESDEKVLEGKFKYG